MPGVLSSSCSFARFVVFEKVVACEFVVVVVVAAAALVDVA